MIGINSKRFVLCITLLAVFALPFTAVLAQSSKGRGNSRGRNKPNVQRDQRKDEKFVNGHDARDGRWDRKGSKKNRPRR